MPTIRMIALEKSGRARREPARPKSREETPQAPEGGAKGSHDRREEVAIASRSGRGREIGAFTEAQAIVGRHAESPSA
jgi:hypothetical protein